MEDIYGDEGGSCQALNQGSSHHRAPHGTQAPAVADPDARATQPRFLPSRVFCYFCLATRSACDSDESQPRQKDRNPHQWLHGVSVNELPSSHVENILSFRDLRFCFEVERTKHKFVSLDQLQRQQRQSDVSQGETTGFEPRNAQRRKNTWK